ncbi:hypothetical protein AB6E04_18540 [Vibrio amylolyticus]|uniref:hypothetical protein n=1 Tax=Vibrio amylolyticus TaxID=2847292 RepID=UPI00354FE430
MLAFYSIYDKKRLAVGVAAALSFPAMADHTEIDGMDFGLFAHTDSSTLKKVQ